MRVKIFEAADMASGLRKVRRELGPDALILSTRTIKSGSMGMLGKKTLEITAAVDNNWEEKPTPSSTAPTVTESFNTTYDRGGNLDENDYESAPSDLVNQNPISPISAKESLNQALAGNPDLRQEFDELKDMVKNLAGELTRIKKDDDKSQEPPPHNPLAAFEQKLRSSQKHSKIEQILRTHGINEEISNIISGFAQDNLNERDLEDVDKLYNFLFETVADIFATSPPDFEQKHQKRMAFIGPTGVGKTTTLAKIGARYLANHSDSVALITIDTYRIAAVEQLKVYGEIMHLPVEVVISPQQLVDALNKHSDKELILIDTAGRSPQDSLSLEEINTFFTEDLNIENHLVLSATTRDQELLETLKAFAPFQITSTIFTKTDECTSLGVLLNTQIHNSAPLSFITNGQRVPEDIMAADKNRLARLILPPPTE